MLRRRLLTGLLAASGLCAGCGDLGSVMYFLMPEQEVPAEIKSLATSDKKKEIKAMILVHNSPRANFENHFVDRELARILHKELGELVEYNDQHLTLLPMAKIEAFKSAQPAWSEFEPERIGEHFKVDYVINIEIDELSVRTIDSTYRGVADLSVRLVDVKHPDESPAPGSVHCEYPSKTNFIFADETPITEFREKFLTTAAKKVAWKFAPHPERDSHEFE